MAVRVKRLSLPSPKPVRAIRYRAVGLTLGITVLLALLAAHLPPIVPAGANLRDPRQLEYARNIWPESQTCLIGISLIGPWVVYAVVAQGARAGRAMLLLVSVLGLCAATWFATLSLASYLARPRHVEGLISRTEERAIWVGGEGFYLVVSDAELAAARPLLRPGTAVTLYVSPRGHAGFIGSAGG